MGPVRTLGDNRVGWIPNCDAAPPRCAPVCKATCCAFCAFCPFRYFNSARASGGTCSPCYAFCACYLVCTYCTHCARSTRFQNLTCNTVGHKSAPPARNVQMVDKGIWFDNLRRYRSGADPHSPDLTLNCTAVAVLHTTALPAYPGLPELAEIEARVPKVAHDIFRSLTALLDCIDVANQGIQRVSVRAPLDIARKNVRSLNRRPFFLSKLRSGTHKELLQLVVDLSCVEHRTRHCIPLLVDMKIHFALLKLCYGAAYVPWNVPQLLLGFPLVYGVWHSCKYCVELIYTAFLPFIKFLEQGNSLQVGSILPRQVKAIHMEKTLLGLMLATSSNRGRPR